LAWERGRRGYAEEAEEDAVGAEGGGWSATVGRRVGGVVQGLKLEGWKMWSAGRPLTPALSPKGRGRRRLL